MAIEAVNTCRLVFRLIDVEQQHAAFLSRSLPVSTYGQAPLDWALHARLRHGRVLHHAHLEQVGVGARSHFRRVDGLPQFAHPLPGRVHMQRKPGVQRDHREARPATVSFRFLFEFHRFPQSFRQFLAKRHLASRTPKQPRHLASSPLTMNSRERKTAQISGLSNFRSTRKIIATLSSSNYEGSVP